MHCRSDINYNSLIVILQLAGNCSHETTGPCHHDGYNSWLLGSTQDARGQFYSSTVAIDNSVFKINCNTALHGNTGDGYLATSYRNNSGRGPNQHCLLGCSASTDHVLAFAEDQVADVAPGSRTMTVSAYLRFDDGAAVPVWGVSRIASSGLLPSSCSHVPSCPASATRLALDATQAASSTARNPCRSTGIRSSRSRASGRRYSPVSIQKSSTPTE